MIRLKIKNRERIFFALSSITYRLLAVYLVILVLGSCFLMHPAHWGKVYASEAGKAMLDYGFRQLDLPKLIAAVHKENMVSIRVLEKLGLKRIGMIEDLPEEDASFNGQYLFELHRSEYVGDAL